VKESNQLVNISIEARIIKKLHLKGMKSEGKTWIEVAEGKVKL
jgi:hypothetical protein